MKYSTNYYLVNSLSLFIWENTLRLPQDQIENRLYTFYTQWKTLLVEKGRGVVGLDSHSNSGHSCDASCNKFLRPFRNCIKKVWLCSWHIWTLNIVWMGLHTAVLMWIFVVATPALGAERGEWEYKGILENLWYSVCFCGCFIAATFIWNPVLFLHLRLTLCYN